MKLCIAAVQLNPMIGKVEENCSRAVRILDQAFGSSTAKPDLIILPELATTGYNFGSREHIAPYLEVTGEGRSFQLGKQLALKYKCHTVLGYPEKKNSTIYNSAMVISPLGKVLFNYRKCFLYDTDVQWGAEESPSGFEAFDLEIKGRTFKTAVGICMDLNPYQFKAPFDKYEFATFCHQKDVDLVLVPTAWLNTSWSEDWKDEDVAEYAEKYSKPEPIEVNTEGQDDIILDPDEESFQRSLPDKRTARYWIMRMNPLYTNPHLGKKKLVVICNRSGMEDRMMYAGSSSIFRFNGGPTRRIGEQIYIDFDVFGTLGQGNEGVLIRNVDM